MGISGKIIDGQYQMSPDKKYPDTRIPQVGDPWCSAFDKCEEVPETLPFSFLEDNVTWMASNLLGASVSLGV